MAEMVIIKCPECKNSFLPNIIEENDPHTCTCGNLMLETTPNVEEGEEGLFMVSYMRQKPVVKVKKNGKNA